MRRIELAVMLTLSIILVPLVAETQRRRSPHRRDRPWVLRRLPSARS